MKNAPKKYKNKFLKINAEIDAANNEATMNPKIAIKN